MNKIRDNVWISGQDKPRESTWLQDEGITAILNVAYEIDDLFVFPISKMRYLKVGLEDSPNNTSYMKDLACHSLKILLENKEKVLCHCGAGASRSVYVVCRALAEIEGKTIDEVFQEVSQKRPEASRGPLFDNL